MLRAEELRIGNFVYNKHGEYHEIGYNCFQRFRYPTMDNNPSGFRPIELTEEILLKCGFEKYDWQNAYFIKTPYGHLFIHLYHGRIITYFKKVSTDNVGHKMIGLNFIGNKSKVENIIHLHQLQNLYFALTGKELEVKL